MMSEDQLQFIDYRKPLLESGHYTFTATHNHSATDNSHTDNATETVNIHVQGERVAINPEDIYAQYPPKGASGDYSDTIPHIALNKSTLPWTRTAYLDEEYEPWLFLMLINQSDIDLGSAIAPVSGVISDLKNPPDGVFFPLHQAKKIDEDDYLSDQEKVITYVDIDVTLFKRFIADQKTELKKLAHVRRRFVPDLSIDSGVSTLSDTELDLLKNLNPDNNVLNKMGIQATSRKVSEVIEDKSWLVSTSENDYMLELDDSSGNNVVSRFSLLRENSVLIANRFAQTDTGNYPHGMRHYSLLISLEDYLDQSTLNDISGNHTVRLLVTHHWWFNCIDNPVSFSSRCEALDVASLRLPADKISAGGAFTARLEAGLTGIEHKFRLGDHSISWYQGPLVPCNVGDTSKIHLSDKQLGYIGGGEYEATDADKLLVYFKEDGMFDISHATAYELGRFLSQSQPRFMQTLMSYKRNKARYIRLDSDDEYRKRSGVDAGILIKNLPYAKLNEKSVLADREVIKNWLLDLAHLKKIPSWYLLADNQLLPRDALRVFNIDPQWVQSLWLGALSLGGRPESTFNLFTDMHDDLKDEIPRHGMALHSDVVWAYPQLDAKYSPDGSDIEMAFSIEHRLANAVRLYLCKDSLHSASLALPVESLHYGADTSGSEPIKVVMQAHNKVGSFTVPLFDEDLKIIDVAKLCTHFNASLTDASNVSSTYKKMLAKNSSISPAQLGRYLIEGEPKAIYKLGDSA